MGSSPQLKALNLCQTAVPAFCVLLVSALLIWALQRPISWSGSIGPHALLSGLLAGIVLYSMMFWVSIQWLQRSTSARQLFEQLHQLFKEIGWGGIVLLSLLAGIGEELLFRVLIQTYAVEWLGPFLGIAVASLLFGLAHYLSPLYVAMTFVIGALLGVLYLVTDSALLVMAMHFSYDVCAFALIIKYPSLLLSRS